MIKGQNVVIKEGTVIGDNVIIEDDVYIDYNCVIRDNVTIKKGSTIGANCVLGEYQMDFYQDRAKQQVHPLIIGEKVIIRSGSIIYGDCIIGDNVQMGHQVTIREKTQIENNVSIGTLCDIQGNCTIGAYSRLHSNVFIGPLSKVGKYVWIFPHVVLTNDPTPPSENFIGVEVEDFAVIAAGSIVMPGVKIASDSLVAAGAIVTKNVDSGNVVGGNPAKVISTIDRVKNKVTGEKVYPWRYTFDRGMPWKGIGYDEWLTEKK